MRRCPRCTFALAPQKSGDVVIDVCPRCQGAFFDAGEAKALFGDSTEPAAWERTGVARFLGPRELPCPAQHGPLSAFALAVPGAGEVEVDVCPVCRGMWLDQREGARLKLATKQLAETGIPPSAQKTGVGWYLFQLFTALPVEEYNPVRRRPLMCIAVILACTVMFIFEFARPNADAFVQMNGVVPKDLLAGRHLWSIVTHMFMHAGIAHIVMNMYFLFIFGDNVEDRVGRVRFLVLYLFFGLCAMVVQVSMSLGSTLPLVGASGAIAGLMGAYCVLFPRTKVYQVLLFIRFKIPVWFYLMIWIGLQFLSGFASITAHQAGGVAWWAHIGGFAAGALWAALNRHKYGIAAITRA